VPAEDLQREGDGSKRADQKEGPARGTALVCGEAIRQQEAEASAKRHTSGSDQDELWKSESAELASTGLVLPPTVISREGIANRVPVAASRPQHESATTPLLP
jgi:hypothetical protein